MTEICEILRMSTVMQIALKAIDAEVNIVRTKKIAFKFKKRDRSCSLRNKFTFKESN